LRYPSLLRLSCHSVTYELLDEATRNRMLIIGAVCERNTCKATIPMDRRARLVLGLCYLNILLLPGCMGHDHASKGWTILSSVCPCRCITVSVYFLHHACAVYKTLCKEVAVDTLGNRIRRLDDRTDQAISVSDPIKLFRRVVRF